MQQFCHAQKVFKAFDKLSAGDTAYAMKTFKKSIHKSNEATNTDYYAAMYGLALCEIANEKKSAFNRLRAVQKKIYSGDKAFLNTMRIYNISEKDIQDKIYQIASSEFSRMVSDGCENIGDWNTDDILEEIWYVKALNDSTLKNADSFISLYPESTKINNVYDYADSIFYYDHEKIFSRKYHRKNKYNLNIKKLPERKNLKDFFQMNDNDIREELYSYGLDSVTVTSLNGSFRMHEAIIQGRKQVIDSDEGSNVIDWHIGTWSQNDNLICTLLAFIEGLKDEQLKNIYTEVKAQDQTYYEVTFPRDKDSEQKVKVTMDELLGKTPMFLPDTMPSGDLDVTLLTIAYFKRFGTEIVTRGASGKDVLNNFYGDSIYDCDNMIDPYDLESVGYIWSLLYPYEIDEYKGLEFPYSLQDGKTLNWSGKFYTLSDGARIMRIHSFCYHGYDPTTDEIILTGNELTSISQLRLPSELADFFETTKKVNVNE